MLGLGNKLTKSKIFTEGIVTDNLVMKHMYPAGPVQPLSDGAILLDGHGDYIDFGNVCNLGTANFSIAMWVWVDDTNNNYLISKREDPGDDRWYIRYDNNDKIQFYSQMSGSGVLDFKTDAAQSDLLRTWVHIVCTSDRSGASHKIYVNGVLERTDTDSSTDTISNAGPLYLNKFDTVSGGNNAALKNYYCNVGIWSASLTQAQVKSIMWKQYADLTSSETTGLVSWWNLDEGAGTTATDSHGSNNGSATFT